ncbi:acyltransferase family protein [Pseudomonas sp. SM4]|jgi:peptidoglycan/LPS O-acetylase OafA/YrhL|uniref:acyltransferase family protein n=1 Tax=Pseudomonas sp. SM4 TaxID=3424177 RepID=UPI003F7A16CF
MDSLKKNYIPGLDGLRAVSVILVIAFHYLAVFPGALIEIGLLGRALEKIVSVGWIGVDIFFVISGYLISSILIKKPIRSFTAYTQFIKRRSLRLLPAYLACSICIVILSLAFYPNSKILENQYLIWTMSSNIPSIFGDRAALGSSEFTLVHFWSLAVEWHFYLFLPVAMCLISSVRLIAVTAICLAISSRLVIANLEHINYDNAIYSFTLCRGDAIACGILLATLKKSNSIILRNLIGSAGLASLFTTLFCITLETTQFKTVPWLQSYGYTAIAVSIAMITYYIINSSQDNKIIKALELNWITHIGRSSYSIYLWHLPFFPLIAKTAKYYNDSPLSQLTIASTAAVIVTFFFSALSYKYLECRFTPARSPVAVG